MSSLICAHAATDSDSSSMCTIIPFPVLMWNIHFRFFLILLVTFEVNSHKWGWYNPTKVFHPKLHQLGKQFKQSLVFCLGTISLASAIYLNLWGFVICLQSFFFGFGIDGFDLLLLTWEMSTTPVRLCFHAFICHGLVFNFKFKLYLPYTLI